MSTVFDVWNKSDQVIGFS